jgi:hypothetical protein
MTTRAALETLPVPPLGCSGPVTCKLVAHAIQYPHAKAAENAAKPAAETASTGARRLARESAEPAHMKIGKTTITRRGSDFSVSPGGGNEIAKITATSA